jgi:hypothetical protein
MRVKDSSGVERHLIKETRTNYYVRVRLRYQYEGRESEGDHLDFSPGPFGETHARAVFESLPAGAAIRCRVNSAYPGEAVLRPGGFERIRFAYVVLLCFVFPSFAAIGYGIWLKIR